MNLDLNNSNLLFIILGAVVALLGFLLAVYGVLIWLRRRNKISDRLDQFVVPEPMSASEMTGRPIVPPEIRGSLFSRTISSGFRSFIKFLGRYTPKTMVFDLEHKLTIAGNPGNLHASSFFALRLLTLLGGASLAFLFNRDIENITLNSLVLGVLIILICWLFPNAWLNSRVRTRQDEITRGMPDALDMLSVCASAGLAFDQSLLRISDYWDTALGHELKHVTEEMEMGLSRAVALKNMSNRLDVDDLTRFIAIIIQAEKIGMSYADVLHSQALQMRILRQLRAREIANKLPAKMIIPLALLIFPALIAVILGPTIPTIMELFQNF